MVRDAPSAIRRQQIASLAIIGGTLLLLAATIAQLIDPGTRSEAHRNLADLGRAVTTGICILLYGTIFLISRPSLDDLDPQTLPWLQRPVVRRRIAYIYFALGAALIVINLVWGA